MAFKMKKSPIKDMSELRARQRRMSRGESEFQYRNRMRRKASAEAKRNALPTDILTKNIADITQKGDEQIRAKMIATVPQAPKPSPKQTFKQAFAGARKAGKKTFIFEGNLYTTKLKNSKSTKSDGVVNIQLDPEKPNFGAVSRVPFKMKGMTFKSESPVKKTGKYSKEAQRLLDAVPNKEAYDKLSPEAKATFDKAAKKYGLPTKRA